MNLFVSRFQDMLADEILISKTEMVEKFALLLLRFKLIVDYGTLSTTAFGIL